MMMDAVWKLIDKFTALVPEQFQKFLRFGALFLWVVLAAVVTFYGYARGKQNVPATGQDLSLSNIMERVTAEENRRKEPVVVIPDQGELLYESYDIKERTRVQATPPQVAPLPESERLLEPEALPPFQGEPNRHIFPGNPTVRETLRPGGQPVDLLPLPGQSHSPGETGTALPAEGKQAIPKSPAPTRGGASLDLLPVD